MKISKDLKLLTTTQTEMGRVLGITQQRVSQLVKDDVVKMSHTGAVLVIESLKNFYKYQTGSTTGGESGNGAIDLKTEQARHERAKREIAELKLAKMEGDVYDAKVVEMVMIEMLSNLRTQLLGIPSKMGPLLEGKTKEEIYSDLTEEIESKLMELSEYTPELFIDNEWEGDADEVSK